MASGKQIYTPEEAAEFMIGSDFAGVSSDFSDSGSNGEPESEDEVIESENKHDTVVEFADEVQKNNNQHEGPGDVDDNCDQVPAAEPVERLMLFHQLLILSGLIIQMIKGKENHFNFRCRKFSFNPLQ